MGYIGVQPKAGFTSGLLDRFTSTTGTTVTLTHDIASENDIIVFVNFVKQDSTNYSVGGTGNKTLTLGGTLVSSDVVEVHYINAVKLTQAPSAGSVGISELNVSDGSNGQALTTNGSGTLSFSTIASTNGITEADQFVITSNAQIANGTSDLTANIARETDDNFSQIGTGMSESSGIFTFPRTGIYYISALGAWLTNNGASAYLTLRIKTTTNNSSYTTRAQAYTSTASGNDYATSFNQYIFNVNDTTNRKVKFNIEVDGSVRLEASGTKLTFIRLGDAV